MDAMTAALVVAEENRETLRGPQGFAGETGARGEQGPAGRDGVGPDEKVKVDAKDPAAGFLADKLVAGAHTSIDTVDGKLVISSEGGATVALRGGGASLSDRVPNVESGEGAAGTGTKASRDDHTHPADGGGVATPLLVYQNGLVKDWSPAGFDPDATTILIVDPAVREWQAGAVYSPNDVASPGTGLGSVVYEVGETTKQICVRLASGTSGSLEPTWPDDGSPVTDNEIGWAAGPQFQGAWQAETSYAGGDLVTGGGFVWFQAAEIGGTSGTAGNEPDWATEPDYEDGQLTDNDLTWTNSGSISEWQADTVYATTVPGDGSFLPDVWVTPTSPAGYAYFIGSGFAANLTPGGFVVGRAGTSGATEPVWDHSTDLQWTADGGVIWRGMASGGDQTPDLVITGILAPAAVAVLTVVNGVDYDNNASVVIVDASNVEGTYGADAVSEAADGVTNAGNDVELYNGNIPVGQMMTLVYVNGTWQPTVYPIP